MSILSRLKADPRTLVPDLVAGATFAVVNVPQGMANAVLAAVNPVAGLYALMVAMPVGAIFTGSVYMNVSTTGALSVAAGEALARFEGEQKVKALIALVLMVGAIQLAFGLLRMGQLVRFISHAVMTGFISGIAVLIMLGAVPDLTGYESDQSIKLLVVADTLLHWTEIDPETLILGLSTIAAIFAFQMTKYRPFALILALAGVTLLGQLFALFPHGDDARLVRDIADIPRSLPRPMLPDLLMLPLLLVPAFGIALIGLIQGAGVGQSYPNPDGQFPDTSRDFVGQGLANLAAAPFGAIPSGGSMSGTAVTVQAGARTRWANIFGGLFVIVIVFLLVDLVELVPMAALGGLLFVVGLQTIPVETARSIWKTGHAAAAAMIATFLAALLLPLQYAILFGVALSFLLQILQMSNRIELREIELVEGGFPVEGPARRSLDPSAIVLLRVRGPLFFASAQMLEDQLPRIGEAEGACVILTMHDVDDLGSTVIRVLKRYADGLQRNGGRLMLAGVDTRLFRQLERTGMVELLGTDNIFWQRPQLGASMNEAVGAARNRLERATARAPAPAGGTAS
jgi:SulP family sulfate permease